MMNAEDIRELYRYNQWANDRVLEAAAKLSVPDFTKDLGSSYRSVRDTLTHIVWSEWIWLQRWKGISPRHVFDATEFPDVDALKSRWSEHDADQRAFVDAVAGDRLAAVLAYVNLQCQTWKYALWRQMYHVVNHSSYHRGQITTMLRQLKAAPVTTDFLVFHDELDAR